MKNFLDDGKVIADMSCFCKKKPTICNMKTRSMVINTALAALAVAGIFIGSAFLFIWLLTKLWK